MTPSEKAAAVLARPAAPTDLARLVAELSQTLRAHLTALTGDAHRDLAVITETLDLVNLGARIEGFSGAGTRRLDAVMVLDPITHTLEVAIIATKGTVAADLEAPIWGASGPEIGNHLVVTRLLDAAIPVLAANGVEAVHNDPFDERVRAIYDAMGFTSGERLDLRSRPSLERVFEHAAQTARRSGLDLCPMPP